MNRRKLLLTAVLLAVVGWIGVVLTKTQTRITTIECSSCPEPALATLQQLKEKSLFSVGKQNLEQIVAQQDLALVSYTKMLPGSISLSVEPNPPIYRVRYDDSEQYWKISQSGTSTETTAHTELPLFILSRQLEAVAAQYHHYFLEFLPLFSTASLKQKELKVLTTDWAELELQQNITLIFNPTQPTQQQQVIEYLLKNWPESLPKDTKEIDLRFRLPVARAARTKPGDVWAERIQQSTESSELATTSAQL